MGWHDLSPQEVQHCGETAGWPVLIVPQTCAAVDITAHLFPASAQHPHTPVRHLVHHNLKSLDFLQ